QQGQASAYSPLYTAPLMEGVRTDAAVTVGFRHTPGPEPEDDSAPWAVHVFGQKTLDHDPGRHRNDRYGLGGEYQVTERLTLEGEVSDGDLGFGADARADYALSDRGSLYLSYALAGENPDGFDTGRLGRLTSGTRYRLGESTSVFAEGRYEHGAGPTGWTQAYGVDFTPLPDWSFGVRYETGSLADALGQGIDRDAASVSV